MFTRNSWILDLVDVDALINEFVSKNETRTCDHVWELTTDCVVLSYRWFLTKLLMHQHLFRYIFLELYSTHFLLWLFSVRYNSTRSVACMIFKTALTFKQPTWCWWCFISLILYLRITWRHCKHSCWPDTVKLWYNSQWFHTFCIHTLSFGGLIVMFGNCYWPTNSGLFNYYLLLAVNQSINQKKSIVNFIRSRR